MTSTWRMAGRCRESRYLPEVCISGCRGHQESGLRSWRELLLQIYYSTSANLSIGECAILIALWLLAWLNGKEKSWFPTAYSVFLILYITLLRRVLGYNENIRLHLKLWPNAGVWAGNLLNLILCIPFGWTRPEMETKQKENSRCSFHAFCVL